MKYYVRKDASSEIEGPFDLGAIRGWIAGGRFTTEHEALEDRDQDSAQLEAASGWTTLQEIFAGPAATQPDEKPRAFLRKVREQSCYKGLRFFVNLLALAGWAGCLWWVTILRASPVRELFVNEFILGGLALVSVAVVRLMAVLLIDIGDILIERNRRK
jgi:hypothetical protein